MYFYRRNKSKRVYLRKLQKNHKNVELIYTQDGIDYIVKIDNNNRYSKDKITPIPINNITEEILYVHEETFKTR